MRDHKGTSLLIVVTLAVLPATIHVTTRVTPHYAQEVNKQSEKQDKVNRGLELRNRYPVVDFEAPEPADHAERLKRARKSRRYEKSGFAIKDMSPRVSEELLASDWSLYITPLPVRESAAIITGEVLTSKAYLSSDKSGVYSEFTFRIDGILKNDNLNLDLGGEISVDRAGGFVQYPNGHKRLYRIKGQNIPRAGARYALFLAAPAEPDGNFHIVTGYELAAGTVSPLDESVKMNAYEGVSEASFLQAVGDAVTRAAVAR